MSYMFTKAFDDQLFIGPAGSGEFYLVLSAAESKDSLELAKALADARVTFVYSAAPVGLTPVTAGDFIRDVLRVIHQGGADRGFVWLRDVHKIDEGTTARMGLAADGSSVQGSLKNADIVNGLRLVIVNGAALTPNGANLEIKLDDGIRFEPASAPDIRSINAGVIPFEGKTRGSIEFEVYVKTSALVDSWHMGFNFFYPSQTEGVYVSAWLPLAAESDDFPRFYASLNPSDPRNEIIPNHSFLTFTGETLRGVQIVPTTLNSWYRTRFGEEIVLVPSPGPFGDERPNAARLQFNGGPDLSADLQLFHLGPVGDFSLRIGDGSSTDRRDLLCGLQGSEFIAFQPASASGGGDFLRYTASQAAYAPGYPFPVASPIGPPVDPKAPLLDNRFITSWANVLAADSGVVTYVAQPKGMTLFGQDDLVHKKQPSLLGMMDPSVHLPTAGDGFPLVAYAGAPADAANLGDFEMQILGPTRRREIGLQSTGFSSSRHPAKPGALATAPYNTTTPTGFLVTVADGTWTKVLLAQNLKPVKQQMYFCNPSPELQQAFQTSQLFAVIANRDFLGALKGSSGSGECKQEAEFFNSIGIDRWKLRADTGENRYNDYRSVILIKGMKGPLYDIIQTDQGPQTTGLVTNPAQWTQRDELGAPTDYPPGGGKLGNRDPQELPVLSAWLQDYFEAARVHPETEYFRKFNEIAKDPNWTGVLVLRASIEVPPDLAGIVAGVRDKQAFTAHHLGIEITPVSNEPTTIDAKESSSMFGLIYYQDPAFVTPADLNQEPVPIPPTSGVDYEFRLLTLKVLFANTAIAGFQSWSQLTINKLFESQVQTIQGGTNNTVILKGTYENRGGEGIYNLSTDHAVQCYLRGNNIFNKIEIVTAQMNTQSDGSSRFGLSGYLDFNVVLDRDEKPFDVFSFGSPYDAEAKKMLDLPRQGLLFASLGIDMVAAPDPVQNTYTFNASNTRFDAARSTPRAQSLFINMALTLQQLVSGGKDSAPASSGYAPLITDATLSGVGAGSWYGLDYQLNMGTPGNLAGNVGLTSGLLTAWAPQSGPSGYSAIVGLRLPGTGGGAKLISLQNVLKLSIGQMALTFDRRTNSFLLMLTEIALRFLGLLKIPPSGSTTFFLFGNPKSGGKPSGLGWYAMFNRLKPQGTKARIGK